MNAATLQAIRRYLFFSRGEAAALVGDVSDRAWRYWEEGDRPVPDSVQERLYTLVEWRKTTIDAESEPILKWVNAGRGMDKVPVLIWYNTLEDWLGLAGRDSLLWRPQCSIVAELCSKYAVPAISFESSVFYGWLGARPDSELMRKKWARECGY